MLAPLLVALIAMPPDVERALVEAARARLDTPYVLGARTKDGVDCQGLVFLALESTFRCSWRSYDVMPTTSIARQELGKVVVTAATGDLDTAQLRPGDVLHFLGPAANPAEPSITTLNGAAQWVWHMGLYAGAGRFLVGDHYAGRAVDEDLVAYLRAHADTYSGVLVTRIGDRPAPRRCRATTAPHR